MAWVSMSMQSLASPHRGSPQAEESANYTDPVFMPPLSAR
jgi:hypothetical protein